MIRSIISAIGAITAAAAAPAQMAPPPGSPPVRSIEPSKVILVGDSTTAVIGGWGPAFCADHVTSFLACVNLARGGRSSGNYRWEGSWKIALSEMRVPGYRTTWVLIQFGHNDQPGKPGRSTDLATGYPENLRRYVREARAAGAVPILVTPLTRRIFADGRLVDDLAPWAAATRRVATELKVPLLDLHADSRAVVEALGPAVSQMFAQLPPGSPPAGPGAAAAGTEVQVQPLATPRLSFDNTHLGKQGAAVFATIVTKELAQAVPDMRPLLVP
ncbi:lysophospholipase L1-like esterase [Sphingomonas insulae]|uniref:Rhamnogalacturonan acetylesterase n=1 Tax=Sphingomonas insulae TaxID=424800 RepID=A0ABN1I0F2_9SPHN|nr:rhamnogalacturonan acetylesterase [Sphingomonas insulae]NIJ30507.1 lysophospholipase L1-like esterase [Sphingomonas insulae]